MITFKQKEWSDKYHTLSGAYRFTDDRYDVMEGPKPGKFFNPWMKHSEQVKKHNEEYDRINQNRKKGFRYRYFEDENGNKYWEKIR